MGSPEAQAQRLWKSLSYEQRWALGDELVLGTFVWGEWFEEKRVPGTLDALDRIRILWEETRA